MKNKILVSVLLLSVSAFGSNFSSKAKSDAKHVGHDIAVPFKYVGKGLASGFKHLGQDLHLVKKAPVKKASDGGPIPTCGGPQKPCGPDDDLIVILKGIIFKG